MVKYRTLLFDLDDTLLDFPLTERDAFFLTAAEFGLPGDETAYETYHEINRLLWIKLAEGGISAEELLVRRFEDLCTALGVHGISAEQLARFYESKLGENIYYIDGANEVIEQLSPECRMYIVTNGTAQAQHRRLSRCEFFRYIDGVFISQEMGAQKPSGEFFDMVRAQIPGFDRSSTLLVGDSPVTDIRGGNMYGIDTCLFLRHTETDTCRTDTPTYCIRHLRELPGLIGMPGAKE